MPVYKIELATYRKYVVCTAGNEQKFWGDESKHFDNDENAVAVINTRDLKIAVKDVRERLASNSCEYDVGDKNTAKGEVKESNAHHNELHSSTNSQPDENENFEVDATKILSTN